MARSTRSAVVNASKEMSTAPQKTTEVTATNAMDTHIDIDLMDNPIKDTEISTTENQAVLAAPIGEYEEDLIDYDDDELVSATQDIGDDTLIGIEDEGIKLEDKTSETKNKLMAEEQFKNAQPMKAAAEQRLQQAKYVMSLGPQTLLTSSPDMATALQLNDIGDTVAVNASANGVTYEITWKVAGFYGVEPQPTIEHPAVGIIIDTAQRKTSLRDAAPLSGSTPCTAHSTVKCKFGRNCNKGASCPFDHTVKPKLCTWVNTAQGCTKGEGCEFWHENEDVKCSRSTTRFACANGKSCAFKHSDDVANVAEVKATAAPVAQVKAVDIKPPSNTPTGPKGASTLPANAPTGPKNNGGMQQPGKVAGQKRGREEDDEGGNAAQRQRLNHDNGNENRGGKQHRGRGRGNGQGRGRGRGVAAEGGLRIRGAAKGGQ